MTKSTRSRPRKNASPSSHKNSTGAKRRRFWLGLASSAALSFQVASCTFNPSWNDLGLAKTLGPALATLAGLTTLPPALQALLDSAMTRPPAAGTPAGGTGSSTATRFSQCREHFPQGVPPVVPQATALRELCYSSFAVLHSGSHKTPVFVAERLNRANITQAKGQQRTDKFFADARLPRAERAELADYKGSGYSRGHMAPAGNMASAEAMAQSFSLANMVPQNQSHNAGPWSQIEQDTRKYAQRARGDVYVFTGPVFSGPARTIGPGKVQVPSHLFKLVYDASTGKSWAYWQANAAGTRASAPISYDELVRRSGIQFLPS